ncbi:MAG: hypothetical protein LAN61_05755 [Acidobacteriia bacterium]|nr:hypothetical protein [Terriglobia bacterium]
MIRLTDDLRHPPSPEQNYSESKWFSFYDQARDIWISSRIGLEPNRRTANRWLVVANHGTVIYKDLAVNLSLPDSDWDAIEVSGFSIRTLKTMKQYALSFHNPELQFDVTWQAATPVFDYKDCFAPLPPSLASAHYEQSGQVSGNLLYEGRSYAIEGAGHRDHSWGVRDWEGFRSWIAFMAPFGGGSFLHVEQFDEQNTGLTRHGFLYHEGKNIALKDADIELDFLAGRRFPHRFLMRIEDVQGHIIPVVGEVRVIAPLAFGRCTVGESFGTFTCGGVTTAGIIEYGFTARSR